MAQLEDKVQQLEQEIAEMKADIKAVLVDLKELMLRDQNPLSGSAPIEVSDREEAA